MSYKMDMRKFYDAGLGGHWQMSKRLFLIPLACMGIILAGCASSADKSDTALDSGSVSDKKAKTAEAERPSLAKPVLRVMPELLRHNDSSPNNLLLDYSGIRFLVLKRLR